MAAGAHGLASLRGPGHSHAHSLSHSHARAHSAGHPHCPFSLAIGLPVGQNAAELRKLDWYVVDTRTPSGFAKS